MTQVNLLPREVRQRQTARRRTGIVAVMGALLVGVVLALWFLQGMRLHKVEDDLAAQNTINSGLQQQVSGLQKYADLKASLEQRKATLQAALANTVHWSSVLNRVSQVEPGSMWLTNLTGTANSPLTSTVVPVAGAPATTGPQLIGTMNFQGSSLDSQTMSMWLTKLETVKGWVNPWMPSATKADLNGTPVWSFSSSVDLDTRAARSGGAS